MVTCGALVSDLSVVCGGMLLCCCVKVVDTGEIVQWRQAGKNGAGPSEVRRIYRLPIHAAIITQSSGGANLAACQRPAIAGSGAFPSLSSVTCSPQVSVAASDAQKHVERSARE